MILRKNRHTMIADSNQIANHCYEAVDLDAIVRASPFGFLSVPQKLMLE